MNSKGDVMFTGKRYSFGGTVFKNFRPFAEKIIGLDEKLYKAPLKVEDMDIGEPVINQEFLEAIKGMSHTLLP